MQQQTSKRSVDEYGYPLYLDAENDPALWVDCPDGFYDPEVYVFYLKSGLWVKKPNPPTPEAVAKAQFVDKTYVWKEASPKAKSS